MLENHFPLKLANNDKISIFENQWRMLLTIDWESIFLQGVSKSGPEFCLKAVSAKNGGDLILRFSTACIKGIQFTYQ